MPPSKIEVGIISQVVSLQFLDDDSRLYPKTLFTFSTTGWCLLEETRFEGVPKVEQFPQGFLGLEV